MTQLNMKGEPNMQRLRRPGISPVVGCRARAGVVSPGRRLLRTGGPQQHAAGFCSWPLPLAAPLLPRPFQRGSWCQSAAFVSLSFSSSPRPQSLRRCNPWPVLIFPPPSQAPPSGPPPPRAVYGSLSAIMRGKSLKMSDNVTAVRIRQVKGAGGRGDSGEEGWGQRKC